MRQLIINRFSDLHCLPSSLHSQYDRFRTKLVLQMYILVVYFLALKCLKGVDYKSDKREEYYLSYRGESRLQSVA